MLRQSLVGRAAAQLATHRHLDRLKYFRVHMEPLEQRQLLTTTPVWVNDNWVNLSNPGFAPSFGDLVTNSLDTIDTGNLTKSYGITAFGSTVDGSAPGFGLIHDAIQGLDDFGSLLLLEGTYVESDIVIDRPMDFIGAGKSGAARSLIVPEVTSSHSDITNFGVNTHQGIIIYSASVLLKDVALDGNGNGSLAGQLNYHQGITTLYDTQNGGNYNSLHNGSLPLINLGVPYRGNPNETVPDLWVDNVAVSNVFYHGITLSALADKAWDSGSGSVYAEQVTNATVTNVGDVGNQDETRIGILLQNINDTQTGFLGNVVSSTVTNAGVGIATRAFGSSPDFENRNAAHNGTTLAFNTVINAVKRGYDIDFGFRDSYIGNVATFSPGNNAIGLYSNHSRGNWTGLVITGAKTGVLAQNSTVANDILPILGAGTVITGPGSAVAGSVGVLAENSASQTNSAAVLISAGSTIQGFEVGLKADQVVAPGDGLANTLVADRPTLTGNGTGVLVGSGGVLSGRLVTSQTISTTGTGTLAPGFTNNGYYYNSPGNSTGTDIILTPPTADTLNTGNATLTSSATFAPRITGQTGTSPLFNFNSAVNYPFLPPPANPANGITNAPYGALFNWFGTTTQNGNGQLTIGGTATNGHGIDFLFGSNNTPVGGGQYQLNATDISGRTTLNIVAKAGAGNQSSVFALGLFDIHGNANQYVFSFSDLNSTAFTTLSVDLLAPSIALTGPDDHIDLTKIVGYVIGGDQGTINGNQDIPFSLVLDDMSASGIANAQLNVTGTVNLGGATLAPTLQAPFVPTLTQQFTLINNDGADAITGTFAGVSQGAFISVSGATYRVSYTGGTGNDVVLTRENVSTNSTVVGRRLFYNQSGTASPLRYDGNNAAINANDDLAIATDKSAYLPGTGAATFANVTSYTKGINGIMIDIAGTHGTITAADFIFRVGNNNTPNSWAAAPAPNSISVRAGAGVSGSDRVVLTWANGAITKKWLEVIVLANANTNLAQKPGYPVGQGDVFFFGNALGDTGLGNTATQANVNSTDELGARNNPATVFSNVPITNIYDFNRDAQVNSTDALTARNNVTSIGNVTRFITVASPPTAPESADDGGVASALSASSAGGSLASAGIPRWLVNRLDSLDLNSGPIAKFFQHLADENTPAARKILVAADKVADRLGLDDALLDSLLADLGL